VRQHVVQPAQPPRRPSAIHRQQLQLLLLQVCLLLRSCLLLHDVLLMQVTLLGQLLPQVCLLLRSCLLLHDVLLGQVTLLGQLLLWTCQGAYNIAVWQRMTKIAREGWSRRTEGRD